MAVLKMQRLSICALKKDRKKILEKLQSMGVMEVHSNVEDETFEKMDTTNAHQTFEKSAQLLEQGLGVLEQYVPEKRSMFASLEGKRQVGRRRYQEIISNKDGFLSQAKGLVKANKEIAELRAAIMKLENQIEGLNPWLKLDVPMNYEGTRKATLLLGTMASGTTEESIYHTLAQAGGELDAVDVEVLKSDRNAVYMAVLCLKSQAEQVEKTLRVAGFAKPSQIVSQPPMEAARMLRSEKEACQEKIADLEKKIQEKAILREELKVLADYFHVRAEKYRVLGTLPQSKQTFIISGYVTESAAKAVEKAIGEAFDCVIDIEELKKEEEVPVLLKNNGFSASVEGVLESYGLPRKGEVDPTTIMSFFYVFFFGMMLSDAAYGAVIAIACVIVLKKYPGMGESMHKSLKMFMYCGISTIFWGILFGGYFGNVVEIVSETFFGKRITIPALWFVPLNDPMRLLIYSLAFGMVHLFVGLGIKGYALLKKGRVLDFFCDVVLWFAFLIGLVLLLLPTDIFASIAQAKIVFPEAVNIAAKILAIGGGFGILLMSGRSSKNPALRLALGAYDIYNITGWLSDVLSYSRLLALGLATGVIASVVNQMGSMFGKGIVGVIGFIIVFVIGHTLNLAINLLGAYVHTNRLQFVEFFGKFYEGGGKPFEPFKADTKYVDIMEEN